MSTSALFGGLAQGIFGRMRELEDEQRKLDLEDKQQALTGLSRLLEQATPETRPVIYKQMADVMNLRGKHRGVWDMLTGQGRDDYHRRLSSTLDKVYGNVVGPEAYEKLKPQLAADLSQVPGGTGPAWMNVATTPTPDQTAGKIALRDPQREEIELQRQRYGIQNDRRIAEIELRNRLTGERELANDIREADLKKEVDRNRAAMAAFKPIMQRAQAISGGLVPTEEAIDQAAAEYAEKSGLDVEFLKSKIKLNAANTDLAGAKTTYYQSGGSGGADKPITPYQQYGIDSAQRAQAAAVFEKWNKAKANINRLDTEHQAARQMLNQLAARNEVSYDEANGRFYDATGKTVDIDELDQVASKTQALLSKMAKLAADKAASFSELQGYRSTLEGQFPTLYTFGDQWSVTPNPEVGGLAPAGAPRTGNPPPFPAGAVQPRPAATPQYKSTSPLPKGTVLDMGPKGKFRVVGVAGKDKDGQVIHDIVPVTE